MRVAIYVRVSTNVQVEEGFSLDAQIDRCKAYALSQDWEIVETYIEEGESAKDLNRTEVKRMLSDAGTGLFDVLLVYRLDRLTRSVRDLHKLLDTFEKFNIKFRSATEVYDTTSAMGRLFITIVAALAEWERQNLGERVRFGKEQQVKEGKWSGGVVPYGYEWDGEMMHIIPDEYTILRELRRLYMAGNGLRGVAFALNARGMKRRDGVLWSAELVKYTLENPFYASFVRLSSKDREGKYRKHRKAEYTDLIMTDSEYPSIYTKEEYNEHIAVMKKREKFGTSTKADYWFTGILRCTRCGSKMKGTTNKAKRQNGTYVTIMYRCYGNDKGLGCNMPMIRQSVVEDLIMKYVSSINWTQEEVAAASEEEETDKKQTEIEQMQKELKSLSDRRKKWQYMFAEDLISEQDFRLRKREDDEQERIILEGIDRLKAMSVGTNMDIMVYLKDLPTLWQGLTDAERREWMQTIFDSVYVQCEQETGRFTHRSNPLNFYINEINFN